MDLIVTALSDSAQRRFHVENALADLRLDSIEPDQYLLALTNAIAEGWITVEQAIEIVNSSYLPPSQQK